MSACNSVATFEPFVGPSADNVFLPFVSNESSAHFSPILGFGRQNMPTVGLKANVQEHSKDEFSNSYNDLAGTQSSHEIETRELRQKIAELEVCLLDERQENQREMAEKERFYAKVLAEQVLSSIRAAESKIEEGISVSINAILEPFVTEKLRNRILLEFSREIRGCLAGRELTKLSIKGPAHLLSALNEISEGQFAHNQHVDAGSGELIAEIDQRYFTTRLHFWKSLLEGDGS